MTPVLEVSTIGIGRDGRLGGAVAAAPALREALLAGRMVLLRGLLDPAWAMAMRESACRAMARDSALPPPADAGAVGTSPNATRVEIAAPREGVSARAFRTRLCFPWNRSDDGEVPAANALARLRNILAERPLDLGAGAGPAFTVAQVVHYPRGGGFLARHFDHDDGLFCVIVVALSRAGRDFRQGGLFVEPGGTRVDVEQAMRPGDACLFRPELYHGVDPIDPDAGPLDFDDPAGRWVLNPMLRNAHLEAPPPALAERPAAPEPPAEVAVAPAETPPSPEQLSTRNWCRLLGIRIVGQRLAGATVESLDGESVGFRLPGAAGPALRVASRPPGTGPAFRTTPRHGVYYFADGRARLSPAEERFLQVLCELTRRRDTAPDGERAGP